MPGFFLLLYYARNKQYNKPMVWQEQNNAISKEFEFSNFVEAVGFVNKILPIAQAADHHPDLLIHSYKKVRVTLSTHSEGRVTQKDRMLAEQIDAL
jgi:4a-hydroxytetrahydrobiopterin dehydratase